MASFLGHFAVPESIVGYEQAIMLEERINFVYNLWIIFLVNIIKNYIKRPVNSIQKIEGIDQMEFYFVPQSAQLEQ